MKLVVLVGPIALAVGCASPATPTRHVLEAGCTVTVVNSTFTPATVEIKKGCTVAFSNQDAEAHAVVGEDGTQWTGDMTAGQGSWTVTFPVAGSFTYHCPHHPTMRAQVIVR
jgi:plastocyanin